MKLSLYLSISYLPAALAATASAVVARKDSDCLAFTSALTHEKLCCDPSTHGLFWIDKLLGLGICCAVGEILEGLSCVPAPSHPDDGICTGKPVCPSEKGADDLGIKYGHCYALKSLGGIYLGHDSADKYEVLGENPGVVFRVCGDKTACTTGVDKLVGANETWYMQDQMGSPTATGFGWLGGSGDLSVVGPDDALVMGGSSLCFGGKCSICITFPPGGAHAPCPLNPGQSHLGVSENPNNCQSFYWEEVGCRSEK